MLQEELFGTIFSSGSATRKYRKWIDTSTEEEKSGHYRYRSSTGSFPSVEKNIYVNTLIYNGMEEIYSPWFDNTIENNDRSTLKKELKWTTEPYDFTTVRWMYRLDKNGNKVNPTPLRGRIKYMDQVDKQQKKEVEIKMTTNRLFLQQINI